MCNSRSMKGNPRLCMSFTSHHHHHYHHHHHGEDGSRPERPLYPRNKCKITNTCPHARTNSRLTYSFYLIIQRNFRVLYAVRRPCSDFMDMLRRLTNCRIIIIIIYVAAKATYIRLLLGQNGGFPALAP